MDNYAFIMNTCKQAHFGKWEEADVKACVERLPMLSREELVRLLTSRWLKKNDDVRKEAGKLLFKEQLESHQQMIASSSIEELGEMLTQKDGNNVRWARQELKQRYPEESLKNQLRIISFFLNGTTKQDVQWGKVREKWQQRGRANPPTFLEILNNMK